MVNSGNTVVMYGVFYSMTKEKNTAFLIQVFTRTNVLRAGSAKTNGVVTGKRTYSVGINTCWEHPEGANQRQTKKPHNGRYNSTQMENNTYFLVWGIYFAKR
ncbi:uncharacterized protein LOC143446125 [Clavelina lepadiformis]|uniref:uncharacterized protein LOC143446125 n=1 Tax=Clavelina lepadiformis TaxID=159417 RepID=UPI0040433E5A